MPTASTKRGAKRKPARRRAETNSSAARAEGQTVNEVPEPRGGEIPERACQAGFVAVVAVAALLRFVYLELNPLH
ncbi:MAG TPA: hypothetical protein VGV38_20645, partial [Pyrinomonadaceae bacterium]|nr:hypothetical protein [Pyrinomonadaceae bacterium]